METQIKKHSTIKGETHTEQKVRLVREAYEKYDNGDISKDKFKDIINKDLKIGNEAFNGYITKMNDTSSFKEVVKTLNITKKKHNYYPSHRQRDIEEFNKTEEWITQTEFCTNKNKCNSKRERIIKLVKDFTYKGLPLKDFEDKLKANKINPNCAEINKNICSTISGGNEAYHKLLYSILNYNEASASDPQKINIPKKNYTIYTENELTDAQLSRGVYIIGNKPFVLTKKRHYEGINQNLGLNKNLLSSYSNYISQPSAQATLRKMLINGRECLGDSNLNTNTVNHNRTAKYKKIEGLNSNFSLSSPDCFNERPCRKSSLTRKDPNFSFGEEQESNIMKKKRGTARRVEISLLSSKDNPLTFHL